MRSMILIAFVALGLSACSQTQLTAGLNAADAAAPVVCASLPKASQAKCNSAAGIGLTLGTIALGASASIN